MKYNYIGKSGLRVSNICMGTMTFGKKCDKKVSFEILDKAYANGVNFFYTAEVYPVPPTAETYGITEEIFGEWMAGKPRDSIILATKVAGAANGWFVPPVRHGLTAIDAFHITTAIEGGLRRHKTDCIDLYQVHRPLRFEESGRKRFILPCLSADSPPDSSAQTIEGHNAQGLHLRANPGLDPTVNRPGPLCEVCSVHGRNRLCRIHGATHGGQP
jgi:aryl-alcohol dehydrogenase-like predicted oxidoreductase